MALVIFPTENWDSYASISDINDLFSKYVKDTSNWDNLTDTQKEIYLRQNTLLIKNKIGQLDETSEADFEIKLALTYLTAYSIGKDMLNADGDENIKVIDISGTIRKEYFTKGKKSNDFPAIVKEILQPYGYGIAGFRLERS